MAEEPEMDILRAIAYGLAELGREMEAESAQEPGVAYCGSKRGILVPTDRKRRCRSTRPDTTEMPEIRPEELVGFDPYPPANARQ